MFYFSPLIIEKERSELIIAHFPSSAFHQTIPSGCQRTISKFGVTMTERVIIVGSLVGNDCFFIANYCQVRCNHKPKCNHCFLPQNRPKQLFLPANQPGPANCKTCQFCCSVMWSLHALTNCAEVQVAYRSSAAISSQIGLKLVESCLVQF